MVRLGICNLLAIDSARLPDFGAFSFLAFGSFAVLGVLVTET